MPLDVARSMNCAHSRPRPGARRRPYLAALEALESRTLLSVLIINGGKAATYTDIDGDTVTITVSKGTLEYPDFIPSTGDNIQLQELDLSGGGFDGANISMKVVKNGTGNGFADIGYINASGQDLGTVSVLGDLGRIDAGDGKLTAPAVKSLSVRSIGGEALATQGGSGSLASNFAGGLGALKVTGDINGASLTTFGTANASIGAVTIGDSLLGNATDNTGEIVSAGGIGAIKIGGSMSGGGGNSSGAISAAAGSIAGVTIGGSITGSDGDHSGQLYASAGIGNVSVSGGIFGGAGANSAEIAAAGGKLGTVKIIGSVFGGGGESSAEIFASSDIGAVTIGGSLSGGAGQESGELGTSAGKIASVTIGGSLIGGSGDESGRISSIGDLGAVKIAGLISGNLGLNSGGISTQTGKIASVSSNGISGGDGDLSGQISAGGNLGAVKITGSVIGGGGNQSAQIQSINGAITSVSIGGNFAGGGGDNSGQILAEGALGAVKLGGNLQGGGGAASGAISSSTGKITSVSMGGSLVGGAGAGSAQIAADSDLGQVTIGSSKTPHAASLTGGTGDETADILSLNGNISGISIYGDLIGGAGAQSAEVYAAGTLGNVKITGNLMGMNGSDSAVIFSTLKLAGVSVGGSVSGGTGDNTGVIQSKNDISNVSIGGSLEGGSGNQSGVLLTNTSLPKVTIGGNISGGAGTSSGVVAALDGAISSLTVAGTLTCGANGDGGIQGGTLGKITIGGDVNGCFIASTTGGISSVAINGSLLANANASSPAFIEASTIIGSVAIKGSVTGVVNDTGNTLAIISAAGGVNNGKKDLAISSVTIGGNVDLANILAGYTALSLTPADPNAQIGTVSVTGNWTAGSIVAGAQNTTSNDINFGDANDARITSTTGTATPLSTIASIKIGGTIAGTPSGDNSSDHFGFVAQEVGALTVGGAKITLTAGSSNDNIVLGTTGDFNLHEIT